MSQYKKLDELDLDSNKTSSLQSRMNSIKLEKSDVFISLHSDKSPGHTFNPVMKRPEALTINLPTLEEQQIMQKENNHSHDNTTNDTTPSKATGFAFPPVSEKDEKIDPISQEQVNLKTDPILTTSATTEEAKNTTDTQTPPTLGAERVIPQTSSGNKHKSESAKGDKVPSKYRRLLIVILIVLALLLVFFLLKPQTPETVESLQEQGTSLPIEFRPVDEEEAKRAEKEAKELQLQAQQTGQATNSTEPLSEGEGQEIVLDNSKNNSVNTASAATPNTQQEVIQSVPATQSQQSLSSTSTDSSHSTNMTSVKKSVPNTNRIVTRKEEPVVVKHSQRNVTHTSNKTNTRKDTTHTQSARIESNASTKTMTVPKGVSLMQVFRDHNLNISDVNAMSKTNNIVSNLKAGEKITVHLDSNNRVTEMRIGSAGKFTRQANGSYIYK
ncbi:LysM-like peptidoglycan-binding domain-containing protein [Otariodibacter sp.]|uniref:LysM-like peptidoglycan-binding domain-containing protein n=1 Tax=Otariodibacter sp. TaxID=3030919 RepID=UPI0026192D5F|nr:LysM-like peptidoglycan-binding domain-containing protein [Otariodibacter sp.]